MSGIGAFRKTETCTVIADLWSTTWLYRILGERTYGDNIEQMFFNAGPAPVARDFQTMSYYQSPNRIRADALPREQPRCPGTGGNYFSSLGCSNVLCCVGAVNRLIPSYVRHMWMETTDHGLAATLYGPCTVAASVASGMPVKLDCRTAYPFTETIQITLQLDRPTTFPLYFRIPAWCSAARIVVNGSTVSATPDDRGFARIARTWRGGDRIELKFPMSPRVTTGYETEYPRDASWALIKGEHYFSFLPAVMFEPRRLPYASVLLGPLLFALPIADLDPNTPAADAKWRYALDAATGADIKIERSTMPAQWDWPLASPVALKVHAKAFDWNPTDVQPLPDAPATGGKAESIRLVPYGCTKFRVSMFPVTAGKFAGMAPTPKENHVDFRYSPPEWQAARFGPVNGKRQFL